ncbi:MAG TPA: DUF92 domain-containing protein [Thermoanaerobaculia bacterium]|nr:DUF92 domain-containing protein [Thermoanaerobaculia bacterium]
MGLFALALKPLSWPAAAALAAVALAFNLFAMPWIGRGIYRDPSAARDRGIVSYAAVVLALVLLFRHRIAVAGAVWGMLAFGDPAAAIVGRAARGPALPWNPEKTWAGLLANFAVSAGAGLALFAYLSPGPTTGFVPAVLAAAAAFALAESLRTGVEDNLVAPAAAALVLWGALAAGAAAAGPAAGDAPRWLLSRILVAAAVNAAVAVAVSLLHLVSPSGAAAGLVLGTIVLGLGGWPSYALLWAFFLVATAATKLGYRAKLARGVAQAESGRRGARHAVANCGVAAAILLVAGAGRGPLPVAVLAAVAGAFAAALADTLGTEVGSLAGRRPVSLATLSPVPAGTPGAVSWPGTTAGAGGALLIALLAWGMGMVPAALVPAIALAGVAGSLAESILADLGSRRGFRLDHEFSNALNTLVGAAVAAEIALSLSKGALYVPFEN